MSTSFKLSCVGVLCAIFLAIAAPSAFGQATVTTDKEYYIPGETVIIAGTGWIPGESVSLSVLKDFQPSPPTIIATTADADGNIIYQEFVVAEEQIAAFFSVQAQGEASGLSAETSFSAEGTEASSGATVASDKGNYFPDEVVVITGTGWTPGESVSLSVNDINSGIMRAVLSATADGNGDIENKAFVVGEEDIDRYFRLQAQGQTSGFSAETHFADALINFTLSASYPTGSYPFEVCASDLDGDGDDDLVVTNSNLTGTVSVLENDGSGTFAPAVNYAVGSYPYWVCASDFDGDGDNDLAVSNHYSHTVSVLKNDGTGTFSPPVNYPAGLYPFALYASDLDGDGRDDLTVTNLYANTVSVLHNDGNGTFAPAVNYAAGDHPYSVCASDLDGDGDDDLVVANWLTQSVSVLQNYWNGTFAPPASYAAPYGAHWVCASDLDRDGDNDLAVANFASYNVSVLQNYGNGTFAPPVNYAPYYAPRSVCASDLDGDGDDDLVVTSYNHDVSVLLNTTIVVGTASGHVYGDCAAASSGLYGVTVDVFKNGTGTLVRSEITGADGSYEISNIEAGDYTLTVVLPLGYDIESQEIPITVPAWETVITDIALTCLDQISDPRGIGFWKHQVGVALGGRGAAEIDPTTLCNFLDAIESHFNNNTINQVVVYEPPQSGECVDKLDAAKSLLNLHGNVGMLARAKQHFMALLFNVASGRLLLNRVISEDGATLSQAITYCDWLLTDTDGKNDLTAMNLAEMINKGVTAPMETVPLDIDDIAYVSKRDEGISSEKPMLLQNYPNPFNPTTTITYSIVDRGRVTLKIFNVAGRMVRMLVDENQMPQAGGFSVVWDGLNDKGEMVASGIYFYKLSAKNFEQTKKLVLLR